ncbi:MAG: hypothetical protein U1F43_19000 [Myxococcota bacterium]
MQLLTDAQGAPHRLALGSHAGAGINRLTVTANGVDGNLSDAHAPASRARR